MANKYWVGGSGLWSSTTNWKTASGGATNSGIPTSSDVAIIDGNSGSPTITISTAAVCGSLLVQSGANLTTAGTSTLTVSGTNGSVTFNEYVNWGNTGIMTISSSTAGTFKCSGSTLRCPITFSGTGGITLQDTFTMGPATTAVAGPAFNHTAGTLNLNNQAMNIYGTMSISSATARSISFGSAGAYIYIAPGAAATAFTGGTLTSFTFTGTSRIIVSNNSSAGIMNITAGAAGAAQAMNFELSAGTSITLSGSILDLNCQTSSFSGNLNLNGATTVFGNVYLSGSMTQTSVANVLTMTPQTGTKTLDTAGIPINFPITLSGGATSIVQLANAVYMGGTAAKAFTITSGTFDVNGYALVVNFAGSTFVGSTGTYTIKNVLFNSTYLFTIVSGTCTLSSSISSTSYFGGPVTLTAGTLVLAINTVIQGVFTHTAGTINLSTFSLSLLTSYSGGSGGKAFTFGTGSYITVGDPNYSSAPTGTAWVSGSSSATSATYTGTSDTRLYATGGTITILANNTEATSTNWTFSGGSYQLNISSGSAFRNFTITNTLYYGQQPNVYFLTTTIYGNYYNGGGPFGPATFSSSSSTLTFGGTLAITRTINSDNSTETWSQPITFSTTGGTTSLSVDLATSGAMNFSSGTLNLNNHNLTCGSFVNNSGSTRVLNFGTAATGWNPSTVNAITITGNGTVYNGNTPTGYSHTGSYPLIRVIPAAPSGTIQVTTGAATADTQALNFQFYNGSNGSSYTLGFLNVATYTAKDVDFGYYGAFTGTWSAVAACSILGSLALNSSMTITTSASAITFSGTSTTNINYWAGGSYKVIYNNGLSITFPIAFSGVGSIWYLYDAMNLTSATTPQLGLTNGTLNLNGNSLTTPMAQTNSGTKNLTFYSGTLYVTNGTTTAFNNANPTGFTTTAGNTIYGYIILTSATAKTFVGGGSTYNCIVQTTGAGAMTVSGNNTFTGLYFGNNTSNGAAGNLIITGSNTVADFELIDNTQNTSLTLTAATTQTLTGTISLAGNYFYGTYLTIQSGTVGSLANFTRSGNWTSSQFFDYCIFKDMAFLPTDTAGGGTLPNLWYGGNNSYNGGNTNNVWGIQCVAWAGATSLKTYYISNTATTTWTAPSDWNPYNNQVFMIAPGGGGGGSVGVYTNIRTAGGGGGGGGMSLITNYPDVPSTVVPLTLGTAGTGALGTSSTSTTITASSLANSGGAVKFGNQTTTMWYGTFSGSQYLDLTTVSNFAVTDSFSYEAWIYPTSVSGIPVIFDGAYQNGSNAGGWYLYITPSNVLTLAISTGGGTIFSSLLTHNTTIPLNTWTHVAVSRSASGTVLQLFVNGTGSAQLLYSTYLNINSGGTETNWNPRIGARVVSGAIQQGFIGRISNARFIDGESYQNNFVPPSTTLTGGVINTLNSSTVVDNSGNGYSITNVGGVTMTQGMTLSYMWATGGVGGSSGSFLASSTWANNSSSMAWSGGGQAGVGNAGTGGSGGGGGLDYQAGAYGVGAGGGGGSGGGSLFGGYSGAGGGAGTTTLTATQVSGGGGGGTGPYQGGGTGTTTVGGAGGGSYFDGSGGGVGTTSNGGAGTGGGGGAGGQNAGNGGNGSSQIVYYGIWGVSGASGGSAGVNNTATVGFGAGGGGAGQIPTATSGGAIHTGANGGAGFILIAYYPFNGTITTGTQGGSLLNFFS